MQSNLRMGPRFREDDVGKESFELHVDDFDMTH